MKNDILLIGGELHLPLYKEALHDEPIEFRITKDLRGCMDAIKEKPPHLLLVDHPALGPRSVEICTTLKKYPGTQYFPILLVISREHLNDLLQLLFIPINDYIFTPLDAEDFRARVQAQWRLSAYKEEKKLQSVDEKREELTKLLEVFPDFTAARLELAELYERTNQIEQSLETLFLVAKSCFQQKNLGQALDILTRLKKTLSTQGSHFKADTEFLQAIDRCMDILKEKNQ